MINALITELELRKSTFQNKTVETIYFGGGTPSMLSVAELKLLIDAVHKNYTVCDTPEITLEANPDDLMTVKSQSETIFENYRSIGINRLSIGIQSFFEDDLKSMNRAHNAEEAKKCLEEATQFFDNITIDLIYGIPNMSLQKWNENLQIAFNLGIHHISSYALTVEPKTALDTFIAKGDYPPVDEALALAHFNHLIAETTAHGFVHYEISNFGKPDYFSKHNTSYWQGKPYLGIGPSAHSFIENTRSWNIANNTKYINAFAEKTLPSTSEVLSTADQYNEYVMTGLRTIWGISLSTVLEKFGTKYHNYILSASETFITQQLLYIDNDKLLVTAKGKFLSDGIASDLFKIN